jgi:hypothetical protein
MRSRQAKWAPQPRPDWVRQINEEGDCMNISGVVPLDEDSLLSAAQRATGLSDFGPDDWREPFRVFIKALEEESELNLMGRIRTRSEILQLLEARLRIEDACRQYPEIEAEVIEKPIILVGQGRSGTSFLLNLLSEDPDNGVIRVWEAIYPCPPPEKASYLTDPRIDRAHRAITQWNRVTPEFASMHEFAGSIPAEDSPILAMNFMSVSWLAGFGQVPSYDSYMAGVPPEPALLYHRRVLKLLQWKNPRRRWVLKDPLHLDRLEALLRLYPDACIVWPHRDPVRAMASVVSLLGTIQWGRSDHPFKGHALDIGLDPDIVAARFGEVIDKIESGAVPKAQIFNLLYADLIRDPVGTAEAIYAHFGIEFTQQARGAMNAYCTQNPRDARAAHRIAAGSDEDIAHERRAFARYQAYFGIPSE